ncbi:unnamed protein product [Heligmosomoides polygyrus]|uniref:Sulfate_transp domain-containing protein n=1 Tax=Heligmosomoides polygyrus TaxID=6339 RepID=A0A183GC58_HELPZ|nr:unnamed protein product [Heligmosomoides polygyrus]
MVVHIILNVPLRLPFIHHETAQEEFDRRFQYERPHHGTTTLMRVASFTQKFWRPFTSPTNFARTIVSFLPILNWLPRYELKTNLLHDVIGGLTVGIMHVPQGRILAETVFCAYPSLNTYKPYSHSIAYALLAGVDPVVGLYTSFFPVLMYMFFGTSRHCSTGTFAVVALMAGKAVHRLTGTTASDSVSAALTNLTSSEPSAPTAVQVASALTMLIGIIQAFVAGGKTLKPPLALFVENDISAKCSYQRTMRFCGLFNLKS